MRKTHIYIYVTHTHGERERVKCGAHSLSPHVCVTYSTNKRKNHISYKKYIIYIYMYIYIYKINVYNCLSKYTTMHQSVPTRLLPLPFDFRWKMSSSTSYHSSGPGCLSVSSSPGSKPLVSSPPSSSSPSSYIH